MNERLTATVGARITEFRRKMAEVKKMAKTVPNKIVVNIEARVDKFQRTISRIANTMQSVDTIARNTGQGLMLMASPGLVPIISSLIGVLGALGPMIGTIGGSAFALATAFGFAGTAALAFGAVAVPTITKLFEETGKLSAAQEKARGAFDKFKATWAGIVKDLEKPVLQVFTKAMQAANTILKMARPLFDGAAKAANNLMTALNKSLDSAPIKAFFDYMNKQAGSMLETLGKAIGNFLKGFMSMMTAFGPLAEKTAQGFLSMSKGFATWAAGLSKSEKFQSFVNYIKENMPKIRAIFRDALAGIVYFFSAFGPLSSDMMTGLQRLMGKFKEWASTLKNNQAFQDFIGYIRENAPKVITLIGNLINFLVNMGVALAPMGAKVLDIANKFIAWTNSMMEAHPMFGKIVAVMLVFGGALLALIPNIVAVVSFFGGFGGAIIKVLPFIGKLSTGLLGIVTKVGPKLLPFLGKIVDVMWNFGTAFLRNAARIAASWLIAMGPIGWITIAVVALVALIIANWDTVKAWTIKAWSAISNFISDAATKILGYIQQKFPALYTVIKSYMKMASDIISAIWTYVKGTFKNVLAFLKALVKGDFQGMKDAISKQMELSKSTISKIWNAIKTFFGTVLSNIWSTVKSKFSEIINSIKEKMNSAKQTVMAKWEEAKSATSSKLSSLVTTVGTFFKNVVAKVKEKLSEAVRTVGQKIGEMPGKVKAKIGEMTSAGADLIRGLISGIKNMSSAAIESVAGVVGGVISKAKSLLKIKSPSRVFKQIGEFTGQGMINGMGSMNNAVSKASERMARAAMIEPQRTQFAFDAGLNTSDFGRIRHDFGAEVSAAEMPDPVINVYNEWDGDKVVARVERSTAKKNRITDGFYGK